MNETERKEIMLYLRSRGLTLDRIGKAFGLTRERVRQIIGNTGHVAVVSTPPVAGGAPTHRIHFDGDEKSWSLREVPPAEKS